MRALVVLLVACGGATPPVRYYQLASEAKPEPAHGDRVIAVDTFSAEGAYDDERMIYRANAFSLDYYEYHRWSASPGTVVGGFFEQALTRTGAFRAVVREQTPEAALLVRGRIVAIEEIDHTKTQWLGRVAVQLSAANAKTGETVWAQSFDETEPMPSQSPEGLARAVSIAVTRIADRAAPELAKLAERAATAPADAGAPAAARAMVRR